MDQQMSEPATSRSATTGGPAGNIKVAAGYILQGRLGSGSFATVYKGVRHPDFAGGGAEVAAIKAISRSSKKLTKKVLENLDMEIAILRTYRHRNIVCLHEVQKTERHFYLVLEYCGGGDLQRLIRTRQAGRLSERLVRRLVRDLTAGLGFLWGKELVHRDIKPQNLLLTGPLPLDELNDPPARPETADEAARRANMGADKFALKIADFGFARHLAATSLAETLCGSPLYMAPEILQGQKYDAKADLWSVGTVLFEMISGKPPFHGENHLDLLRNIQRKAVRLPPDVRVTPQCVKLLRILLDRKPNSRADFASFFEASDAFVALGCGGTAAPPSADGSRRKSLRARMDLCAISENEGTVESGDGNASSMVTVATLGTINQPRAKEQPPDQQQRVEMATNTKLSNPANIATSQPNTINAMAHVKQDHKPRPGVVTPPFNPISAPSHPLSSAGFPGALKHGRPSVFAPLQASPNFSPSTTPVIGSPPPLSLQDAALPGPPSLPLPKPGIYPLLHQKEGIFPPFRQQPINQPVPINHQMLAGNNQEMNAPTAQMIAANNQGINVHKTSCRENYDSGFVLVEHSGCASRPGSGHTSPATSIAHGNDRSSPSTPTRHSNHANHHLEGFRGNGEGLIQSPSTSPHYGANRMTILNPRGSNAGLLSTSPRTGRALVGKMMGSPPAKSSLPPPPITGAGKLNLSPRSALRSGGCLAHIENLARMLAAAEDIGRRAITVAHLGDVRAYLGMGLLVAQRDESQSSSASTCTPMEGVEEEGNDDDAPFATSSARASIRGRVSKKAIIEEEDDEMPFAVAVSSDDVSANDMSQSPSSNILPHFANIIGNNVSTDNTVNKDEVTPSMIQLHFREALMCYLKTLNMMKGSIRAAQKVMSDVDEVIHLPSAHSSPSNNPYTPLKKRCNTSLEWLSGQFSAVLERADAASEQITKSQKAHPSHTEGESSVCVEELIYNHSLKCGREGAVKQLLGHYDAARSCYRSAGLLAETLLMEPKVGEEDRAVLEGYVQSFADQITELDGLIRSQMKSSRASGVHTRSMAGRLSGTANPKPALTN